MRFMIVALVMACGAPAAAQTPPASTEAARVAFLLGAIWRPLAATQGGSPQALMQAACEGALEEMAQLDLRLPEDLTPEALAPVRAARGLVIVPTEEDPAIVFIFPDPALVAIASGLGQVRLDPAGAGRLVLRDAAGGESQVQLGSASGHRMMRLRPPGETTATLFVGCAPTTGPSPAPNPG
jgi:hypothetical protein